MGSDSSTEEIQEKKTNANPKQKLMDEYKKRELILIKKVSSIKQSLATDEGIPNLVDQFSNMLELEGNNTNNIDGIVNEMKKRWNVIDNNLQYIEKELGKKEVNELRNIRFDYWSLLLKTKKANSGLMEQCMIQKENVTDLLKIVNKAIKQGSITLNASEQAEYNDCINMLFKWIDQKELNDIMQQWSELLKVLEEKRSYYAQLYEKYKDKRLYCRIAIGIGAIGAVAAVVTLIFLTSGAAAAIAAPMAKTVTIGSWTVLTSHLICTGMGFTVGSVVFLGAVVYGEMYVDNKLIENIKEVQNLLQQMLKSAASMSYELSKLDDDSNKVKTRLKYLDVKQSNQKITKALKKIDKHLISYLENGANVNNVIEKACKDYIKEK